MISPFITFCKFVGHKKNNMYNKLSVAEAFCQLQTNCDFVEKSVKKELSIKGRANLLIFNYTALLLILNEDSINNNYSLLIEFVDIVKSKISNELGINLDEAGNYIGSKMDIYSPLLVNFANGDEIVLNLVSEFYFEEIEMEFIFRLGLSLSYLTNMIVMIAEKL